MPDAVSELNQVVEGLSTIARDIAVDGSKAARQAILDTVTARRGTLSVSGLGATLDVQTTTTLASDDAARASLHAAPAGAWALVDKGAKPHTQRRRRGMPADPYGVFSRINHPGVAGLNVVGAARRAADDATNDVAQEAVRKLPRR